MKHFNISINKTAVKCIVCDNQQKFSLVFRVERHHLNYYRCKKCGFVFAHPQVTRNPKFSPFTPVIKNEYYSRMENYLIRYKIFKTFLPKSAKNVLDVGAGNGIFLNFMKERGFEVFGVEPSIEAAKFAKRNFQVDIANLTLEEICVENLKTYDIVTFFNVFEHIPTPIHAIAKVKDILRNNGVLILELPNIFTLQTFLFRIFWHHFELTHYWFFNMKTVTQFLIKHDFEILHICFIRKIVNLSKIFDAIITNTVAQFISRARYLQFRNGRFYNLLNRIKIKVAIHDYFLVIARKKQKMSLRVGLKILR